MGILKKVLQTVCRWTDLTSRPIVVGDKDKRNSPQLDMSSKARITLERLSKEPLASGSEDLEVEHSTGVACTVNVGHQSFVIWRQNFSKEPPHHELTPEPFKVVHVRTWGSVSMQT